ncbi:peptidase [Hydrocarboniphaga sp.]|uniref:peptidase n=1 Tax=Hydrocarboniphaga sp. TaxID=2033016 RepID=UPI003D0CAA97
MIKQVSSVFAAAVMLAACTQPSAPPVVGGDRDAHGCIGSAGYSWCAREALCVRPWELAGQRGFANEANAFDAYCAASAN